MPAQLRTGSPAFHPEAACLGCKAGSVTQFDKVPSQVCQAPAHRPPKSPRLSGSKSCFADSSHPCSIE